ncbi:MAG TPA: hypothetical protein VE842_10930, partial [Pyrinomonadaceae bacterium]|nr:hypothetical protein [Pyrinomonadaceae bacterium]
MKVNFLKRMMVVSIFGVVSLLGPSGLANAQQRDRGGQQRERGREREGERWRGSKPQQEQRGAQ